MNWQKSKNFFNKFNIFLKKNEDKKKSSNNTKSSDKVNSNLQGNEKSSTSIPDIHTYNKAFKVAAEKGDVDKLTESFNMAKGKIRDRTVYSALKKATLHDHCDIIENFPKQLILELNIYYISKLLLNIERKKENKSLRLLMQKVSKYSYEYKDDPFCQMLNKIRKGDLIYGISVARKPILVRLFHGYYPTADNLNQNVMHTESPDCHYFGDKYTMNSEVINHATYLEKHPKYNPCKVLDYHPNVRDIRVKRACKAAICNILESERDARIHFITDGFDPIKALNKDEDKISFTNSELRLIYRKWLQNPELVNKRIIFWDQNANKKNATEFFNSISNKIFYVPKSLKDVKLQKLKNWSLQNNKHNSKLSRSVSM